LRECTAGFHGSQTSTGQRQEHLPGCSSRCFDHAEIAYCLDPTDTEHYWRRSITMSTLQEQTAAFAQQYAHRPIPAEGPIDTSPIDSTPDTDEFDALWRKVIPETRARGNDFHLPLSVAYAHRLCEAYPQADRRLVLIATLLHDTGWAHVDEDRII